MSLAEYLAFSEISETKHELVYGQVYAMVGGTFRHALLQMSLGRVLGNALAGRPCRVLGGEMRVAIAADGYEHRVYPDVSVVCGKAQLIENDCSLQSPILVAEVLSKSTERYDRTTKFALYQALPTMREYLLVSQNEPKVEHHAKGPDGLWSSKVFGAGEQVAIPALSLTIAVDDIYAGAFDDDAT